MSIQLLATKLYIPPSRPELVPRPRLIKLLNEGMYRKLTLISAPVGYGKTTILSEWIPKSKRCVTWVSLDDGDNDPARFWAHFIAALQMLDAEIGREALGLLQAPLLPPIESILTVLLNEIAAFSDNFAIVLDDYHVIEARPDDESTSIDKALTFILEHLPPQMHLVITSREDPNLPLTRLRARDQLTEVRVADLRFTPSEAADFLNHTMGLNLSAEDIATLETKTEGWIAGLQLAALSLQGHTDVHEFIKVFAGDDRYIVDFLVEEVLKCQSEGIRSFLLQTSILDRLCGPLCDAVTKQKNGNLMLEDLEKGNLFISPLDEKRHWFRYHQLFEDVLRKYLMEKQSDLVPTLHHRASEWFELNGLEIEAFHHAVAAEDIDLAERVMEGKGMPLQYRGAMVPVLQWLESLPTKVLNARPSLWVTYASALMTVGRLGNIEEILHAAEPALQVARPDVKTRDLIGHVATLRALMAIQRNQLETILTQAQRALEFLDSANLATRATTNWALGYAYQLQGDHEAARHAYKDAISISKASGNIIITMAAATTLGQLYEKENQLYLAAESYRLVLQVAGDPPQPGASEAYLGLARITYQWNDLHSAQELGQQSLQLAQQMENVPTPAACGVLLARLKISRGELDSASANLAQAEKYARQHNFEHLMPEIAASKVLVLLNQGNFGEAALESEKHKLPLSQARVLLAQGAPSTAVAVLEPLRQQAGVNGREDEQLKVMVLQAIALHALGEIEQAVNVLGEVLALAEPEGLFRIFIDEGQHMVLLLKESLNRGLSTDYIKRILSAFPIDEKKQVSPSPIQVCTNELVDSLSPRELEVLQLIAQGLSNREISERLTLSLNTIKGHNQMIFSKMQVQRRTEAVVRARELGLL